MRRPPLYIKQILAWADRHYELTGKWPETDSGRVRETLDEKWVNIDAALRGGFRGLRPGSSLARLLARHRGKRNRKALPKYTLRQILQWADAYHARHGKWPDHKSGLITGTNGETWCAVEIALSHGQRGLPGGSSLARLLAANRSVRHRFLTPRMSVRQILAWADAYRDRTGNWPTSEGGAVEPGNDDTWLKIDKALRHGSRGLEGGSSLFKLLARHRGVSRHVRKRPLSVDEILRWADAHRLRTGAWPTNRGRSIPEAPRETWSVIDTMLREGKRGLPRSSLARLLAQHRGRRNVQDLPPLTIPQILKWADAHRAKHGHWPRKTSGPIAGVQGETWGAVDNSLKQGSRGLPGGSSLARLLAAKRGVPHKSEQPRLSVRQIFAWADAYHDRHGKWPAVKSGRVAPSSAETWQRLDDALRQGYRGLPGGSSLQQLLADRRRASRDAG
ncbi:MAG: hypothetical protein HY000_27075 [Planctomycetes bacterium]|nr:hypothetical protein [Planctomycetota bacterium]